MALAACGDQASPPVPTWDKTLPPRDVPHDIDQIEHAFAAGRLFTVFELMGTPDGFDVRATTPSGSIIELRRPTPGARDPRA